jgi:hypothetical protein
VTVTVTVPVTPPDSTLIVAARAGRANAPADQRWHASGARRRTPS